MMFRVSREKKRVRRAVAESQLFGSLILTRSAREAGFDVAEIATGTRGQVRTQRYTTWVYGNEDAPGRVLRSRRVNHPAQVHAVTVERNGVRRARGVDILDVTVRYEASGLLQKFTMRANGMLYAAGSAVDLPHSPRLWLGTWPDPFELFGEEDQSA